MADTENGKFSPFWILVIVLLLILGALVLFGDVLTGSERTSQEPQAQSTEWAPAPEGGVEVETPETPMRNVPMENGDPATGTAAEESPPQPE